MATYRQARPAQSAVSRASRVGLSGSPRRRQGSSLRFDPAFAGLAALTSGSGEPPAGNYVMPGGSCPAAIAGAFAARWAQSGRVGKPIEAKRRNCRTALFTFASRADSGGAMRKSSSIESNSTNCPSRNTLASGLSEQATITRPQQDVERSISATHERWWTRRDAAEYVGLSEATIGREVRRGRLRHTRVGGRRALRFRREWLDDWLVAGQPVDEPVLAEETHGVPTKIVPRYIQSIRRSSASLT